MNSAVAIDKGRVMQAFSRQATVYEENAPLQKEVAERLIATICELHKEKNSCFDTLSMNGKSVRPELVEGRFTDSPIHHLKVLDIGIGTGLATKEFLKTFQNAGSFGCDIAYGMLKEADKTGAILTEADAEHLPYKNDTFDLAFSSLAFQWTNLRNSINEAFRVLMPHGRIYFSTFGEKTLTELADSYKSAQGLPDTGKAAGTMKFETSERIKAVMESTGFKDVEVKTDLRTSNYPTPQALLRSLKAIGAGNPSREFQPSRTLLNETLRVYREKYGNEDAIPATFEIIYAGGIKK